MRWLPSLAAAVAVLGPGFRRRTDEDRLLLPRAGRRQAGARDDPPHQGLQRQPEGGRRHRRLYRQLRRHQAQGAGRGQRRQAARGGADERQLRARPQARGRRDLARADAEGRRHDTRQVPRRFLAGGAAPTRSSTARLYAVPFQNSTPLLYYNVEHFKEAGLDPEKPPQTWAELVDAAKKLTKADRMGFGLPEGYDYMGWMMEALSMSERRPLLQRGVRRRGLLRHALDAGRGAVRRGPGVQAQGHAAGRGRRAARCRPTSSPASCR